MKYLKLPDESAHILPFYLAMEEYAAHIMGSDDIFFMWQVEPTVIFGRNQLIDNEVNLDYCREHSIAVYRRKSGGGCVYADRSNIMFSYITAGDNVAQTYSRYTQAVVAMLRQLGLNATDNGRNDILIDGLKVSGNAFYHLPGHNIVHGTMLYDTDMAHMMQAITPSRAKLESKGVSSVPSRITTLCQHITLSIEDFEAHARQALCSGEMHLTQADVEQIEHMAAGYLKPEFIYGHNPRCNVKRHARLEGAGEFTVNMEVSHNVIRHMDMAGDFFVLADLDRQVLERLQGVALTREAITRALADVNMSDIVLNLNNEQFINLLINP